MYVHGLADVGRLAASGVMPNDCAAAGGVPYVIAYQVYDAQRRGVRPDELVNAEAESLNQAKSVDDWIRGGKAGSKGSGIERDSQQLPGAEAN